MKKILLSFVLLTVLGVITLFIILNKSSTPTKKNTIRGKLSFQPEIYYTTKTDDLIDVQIIANSANFSIVGYDLDLFYDKNNLQLVNITNSNEDKFDFFSKTKENEVLITGMKKIDYGEKIVFKKTPLAKLFFKLINPEKSTIKLNFERNNKRESNLITEENIDILDQVGTFSIYFGKELNLKLNETVSFDNLILKLINVDKPKESCVDCFEMATLSVKKNNQEKKLKFKTGGFAGIMIDRLDAFSYEFVLRGVAKDRISVSIYEGK